MHKNADDPFFTECRGNILISRSMPLISHKLKMQGIADVIEFHRTTANGIKIALREGLWLPVPVEYKYGQPKEDDTDIVQLTVQAICLEEMFQIQIPSGFIYYGKTKQRLEVIFSVERRGIVEQMSLAMQDMVRTGETPQAKYKKSCKNCSMNNLCLPQLSKRKRTLKDYIKNAILDTE